jgi:hypothetical protein
MIKKLINVNHLLFIIFAAGLTMALLAQWLLYPGKVFQVIGTSIMFASMLFWTVKEERGNQ